MSELVILNLSSILMIIISIIVIFIFMFFLIYLIKQSSLKTEEEEKLIKSHVYDKSLELIDNSRKKSFEIIKESQSQIDQILRDATFLSDDTRLYLKKKIDEVSSSQQQKFTQHSEALFQEGVASIKEMTQNMQSEALKELDSFKNELSEQTQTSKDTLATHVTTDYQDLRNEMLQKLKQERQEIIRNMSEYVLGSVLDVSKHEQLITEALEKAVKEADLS